MTNPIFSFLEEGMDGAWILDSMGFEFYNDRIDYGDLDQGEYNSKTDEWLERWEVSPADGYVLIDKYDTEDGPVAFFVKPKTEFVKVLLEFGFSKKAQTAFGVDIDKEMAKLKARADRAMGRI